MSAGDHEFDGGDGLPRLGAEHGAVSVALKCGSVWGGTRDLDEEVQSGGVTASVFSESFEGGRGGDIYWFSTCGDDLLTRIAVADVCGHGHTVNQVAEWMYRRLVDHMNQPDGAEILRELNVQAVEYGLQAMTTATILSWYRRDGLLRFAYAGAPPILVRRGGSERWRPIEIAEAGPEPANLPLAVAADARFDQGQMHLSPGDRVFLYTDGVLDVPSPERDRFGMTRLIATLDAHGSESPSAIKQHVLRALADFAQGPFHHDDLTLMVIEVH